MRVVIAEDNPLELDYLRNLIFNEPEINIIGEALEGQEALKLLLRLKPDVAFLDISLPGMTGIDLAKKVGGNTIFVFITGHSEFALEAFEIGSVDYILKPFDTDRFHKTINRIRKLLQFKDQNQRKLFVKQKENLVALELDKIIFIEKLPVVKKILIHMENKEYILPITLDSIEEKLRGFGFVRSHKSFVLNLNMIEKLIPWGDKAYLVKMLGTKKEVFISRKYAPIVKSKIQKV